MTITYIHHEGTQTTRPLAIDTESSAKVVYLRKNIEQITKEDESGEEYTVWSYDEAKLTHEDYALYLGEDNSAKIEYVAMMTDVDLEEV